MVLMMIPKKHMKIQLIVIKTKRKVMTPENLEATLAVTPAAVRPSQAVVTKSSPYPAIRKGVSRKEGASKRLGCAPLFW